LKIACGEWVILRSEWDFVENNGEINVAGV
jgi:hypothetical protein